MDYKEYLKSEKWKYIREWAMIFWNYRCAVCNSKERVEVHYRTYENLGHEKMTDLLPMCHRCHKLHTNFTGHFMKGVLAGL
jgi:hypothetical protein